MSGRSIADAAASDRFTTQLCEPRLSITCVAPVGEVNTMWMDTSTGTLRALSSTSGVDGSFVVQSDSLAVLTPMVNSLVGYTNTGCSTASFASASWSDA